MKQLSEGVQGYGESKGYDVIVQDPKLDPQKQVTDLQTVIESGKAAGVWSIAIAPPAMTALVQTALDKDVPIILNGTPEDYGLDGLEPGVSFSTIDYEAEGQAAGEELGNCINERYDGAGKVLFGESAPGTAGKKEFETAVKDALADDRPRRRDRLDLHRQRPHRRPDRRRQRAAGQPRPQRRLRPERRGRARRRRRLQGRRQGRPLHHRGRRQRGDPRRRRVGRHLRRRRAAVRRRHGPVVRRPDRDDRRPEATGVQLTVPQEVVKADG